MVNVALITAFFALFFGGFLITVPHTGIRWYKRMLEHYRGHGSCKKLPNIPPIFFSMLWFLIYTVLTISFYIYFNGNCKFDKFRIFNEDDQTDDRDWIRGLTALIFMFFQYFLFHSWIYIFFTKKMIRAALFIATLLVVSQVIILWAIGDTHQCRRDEFENRNWVAFGLQMIVLVGLLLAWFLNYKWASVIGSRCKTDDPYRAYRANIHKSKTAKIRCCEGKTILKDNEMSYY